MKTLFIIDLCPPKKDAFAKKVDYNPVFDSSEG
jgi:hypothetical protein